MKEDAQKLRKRSIDKFLRASTPNTDFQKMMRPEIERAYDALIAGDVKTLFKMLFEQGAELRKDGIATPLGMSRDSCEQMCICQFVMLCLRSTKSGLKAMLDLVEQFKMKKVDKQGRSPEEAKQEKREYERRMKADGMYKQPGGGWANKKPTEQDKKDHKKFVKRMKKWRKKYPGMF
jgi:hypothetical protein